MLEDQLCSRDAFRYQRAAGEMAGRNPAFRCRGADREKSMQLEYAISEENVRLFNNCESCYFKNNFSMLSQSMLLTL